MRFALIGDIVGKDGVGLVVDQAASLRETYQLDVLLANAENAYNGSGLTPGQYRTLIGGGVDLLTLGDHAYKKREIYSVLNSEDNLIRPANFPDDAPGKGWTSLSLPSGERLTVISLLGRVFMRPVDCPFKKVDEILGSLPAEPGVVLVEFHAEATSDMEAMGHYLDGRVSAVLGTHTHVPTADERILPGGTAFQCDVGMTGPHSGIIGRNAERVLKTLITFQPTSFHVAQGDLKLHATVVETDANGKAVGIERVQCLAPEADAEN